MKKKKIKARLVDLIDPSNPSEESAYYFPADATSVERMVEQMTEALYNRVYMGYSSFKVENKAVVAAYRKDARAALAAIGITSTKQPRRSPNH